jgi:hypothetical protein
MSEETPGGTGSLEAKYPKAQVWIFFAEPGPAAASEVRAAWAWAQAPPPGGPDSEAGQPVSHQMKNEVPQPTAGMFTS